MKLSKINSNGYKIYMEEYNSISEFIQKSIQDHKIQK